MPSAFVTRDHRIYPILVGKAKAFHWQGAGVPSDNSPGKPARPLALSTIGDETLSTTQMLRTAGDRVPFAVPILLALHRSTGRLVDARDALPLQVSQRVVGYIGSNGMRRRSTIAFAFATRRDESDKWGGVPVRGQDSS